MQKSLSMGKQTEIEVVEFLTSVGFDCSYNNDPKTRKYYDIKASHNTNNLTVTFEVKNDSMSHLTKNVCFEFNNSKSNTDSGINATLADYWVHKICGVLYIIKTDDLKQFIKSTPSKLTKFGCGDNNSDFYLYSKDTIIPHMTKLGDVQCDYFMQ